MRGKVTFDTERCKGCELCTAVCPKHIVVIDQNTINHKGYHPAAVTDMGFANALMKALSEKEPERYAALAGEMSGRFEKAQRRKKEAAAHERNKRIGKRRTNV